MEHEKKTKPDSQTIKVWKQHLRDEVDARFLYGVFASLEPDAERKEILTELAKVESRHVDRWREMLMAYDIAFRIQRPTLKARLMAWYARRFGSRFPLAQMLNEEAGEVKDLSRAS